MDDTAKLIHELTIAGVPEDDYIAAMLTGQCFGGRASFGEPDRCATCGLIEFTYVNSYELAFGPAKCVADRLWADHVQRQEVRHRDAVKEARLRLEALEQDGARADAQQKYLQVRLEIARDFLANRADAPFPADAAGIEAFIDANSSDTGD